jgi:hypothetical protein
VKTITLTLQVEEGDFNQIRAGADKAGASIGDWAISLLQLQLEQAKAAAVATPAEYAEELQRLLDKPFRELDARELVTVTAIHATGAREELREMLGVVQALSKQIAQTEESDHAAGRFTIRASRADSAKADRRRRVEGVAMALNAKFKEWGWSMQANVEFDDTEEGFASIMTAALSR